MPDPTSEGRSAGPVSGASGGTPRSEAIAFRMERRDELFRMERRRRRRLVVGGAVVGSTEAVVKLSE
jgi:hypothetical protein